MRLRPYTAPRLPEYAATSFWTSTRALSPILQSMLDLDATASRHGGWMVVGPNPRRMRWQPKLYVCVRARHYWSTIGRLLVAMRGEPVRWKFHFHGRTSYVRPDKIVLYAPSADALPALIEHVRPLVRGCAFHPLSHAAPTGRLGLEPRGASGLYVGCDPNFLEMSWRLYRAMCIAWLDINRAWVASRRGGVRDWLAVMNLSERHEGPASLVPDPAHTIAARRNWKLVVPEAT